MSGLRGDPAGSMNIFNAMKGKKEKGENKDSSVVEEQRVGTGSIESTRGNWNLSSEGGAAYSVRKRAREMEELVGKEKEKVIEKKVIKASAENMLVENVQSCSEKDDYEGLLENLIKLYFIGKLDEYEVEGVDKKRIMDEVKKLKISLNDVIKG